ncbi:ROK family protein [Tenuibacillus multivorans]|uniref:Glucokinase n=1 Tax=Tenuibacillus multivorans TaxID=237069 RepID=A0A1H0BRZ1_9BACI|nr:ROK family protein [Tenuibacillus multivorans]GEL77058.1 glucose kinase [Tenuibacillus multivorans]SDN48367.1 glucokinase [Tenuibacillus multivorans]
MYTIGIDIGGTKILGTIINTSGQVVDVAESLTRVQDGKEVVMGRVIQLIDRLSQNYEIAAIGVGSAGRINMTSGEVYYATPNLPDWTGVNLVEEIKKRFHLPIFADNDVNTAAYSEYCYGNGRHFPSFVFISLGTGVAASFCQNGQIQRGAHWSAGEVGHMILFPNGKQCNCGQRGCFEQYCSGTALVRAYNERVHSNPITNAQAFFVLVNQNNTTAIQVLDQFIDDLSIGLINLSHTFDPHAYIFGGGLIQTKDYWWDSLVTRFQERSNDAIQHIELMPAALNNRAGAIGAAKLAMDQL